MSQGGHRGIDAELYDMTSNRYFKEVYAMAHFDDCIAVRDYRQFSDWPWAIQ